MDLKAPTDEFDDFWPGLIRLHILYHACHGSVYGLEMIEELQRHGYRISPGTLYPILHNMEKKSWLKSTEELTAGKIRRVYRATTKGRKAMKAAKARVHELFPELFEKG